MDGSLEPAVAQAVGWEIDTTPAAPKTTATTIPKVPMVKSKKQKRLEKKTKKLITEFELAKSNDATKRPGELLDFPPELKRVRELGRSETEEAKGDNGRKNLNPTELRELKARLRERKKFLTTLPRFTLQGSGLSASLSMAHNVRIPILVSDVQQLLLYALGGNSVCQPPERWCYLQKYVNLTHIVVLVLEGLSCQDFFTYEHIMAQTTAIFPDRVEVMSPFQYGTDVAQEMACVALSQGQKQTILQKYGSLEAALQSKEVFKVFRAIFPINFAQTEADEEDEMNISSSSLTNSPALHIPITDMFPRTYLLLSLQQMVLENYPLPFEFEMSSKYSDYNMTKKKYQEVSNSSPLFAVDCEMCMTDVNVSELTRIAVVVYESLVKPKNKITNYLTEFSGITKKLLEDVTTTLEDVRKSLRKALPQDAILVGHSLNCDLHALKAIHPYVIDTSVIFNVSGQRNRKPKLSMLVDSFLGEEIQVKAEGHCPVEDATATMKLVQLKLAKGFRFGDALIAEEDGAQGVRECQLSGSIFTQTAKANKTVTVIAPDGILEKYKNFSLGCSPGSFVPISVTTCKQAIEHLQSAAVNNNMSLAHLDLSSKTERKIVEVMSKVDDMIQKVFNHVSKNGLFVTLFTGPNSPSKPVTPSSSDANEESDQSDEAAVTNHTRAEAEAIPMNGSTVSEPISLVPSTSLNPRSLHNGVCFIRINTFK